MASSRFFTILFVLAIALSVPGLERVSGAGNRRLLQGGSGFPGLPNFGFPNPSTTVPPGFGSSNPDPSNPDPSTPSFPTFPGMGGGAMPNNPFSGLLPPPQPQASANP